MSKYTEAARRLLQQPANLVTTVATGSIVQANANAEQIVQAFVTTRLTETAVAPLMFPSSPGTTTNLLRADRVVAPIIRNTIPAGASVILASQQSCTVAGSFQIDGTLTLESGSAFAFL